MKKILIIKTSAIGDVIQAFGVIQRVKESYPNTQIDWVVEGSLAPFVKAHPAVSNVIEVYFKNWKKNLFSRSTFKQIGLMLSLLHKERYDAVFDLQANTKSGLVMFCVKAYEKLGYKKPAEWLNRLFSSRKIEASEAETSWEKYHLLLQSFFPLIQKKVPFVGLKPTDSEQKRLLTIFENPQFQNKPLFFIGFGSNWDNKKLKMETYRTFLQMLQNNLKASFVLAYTLREKEEALALTKGLPIVLLEDLSLVECQQIMTKTACFIGVDSALLHLAQITQIPSFAIFGPSSGNYYMQDRLNFIQGSCPYKQSFDVRCKRLRTCRDAPCMKGFSAEELFNRFFEFSQATFLG